MFGFFKKFGKNVSNGEFFEFIEMEETQATLSAKLRKAEFKTDGVVFRKSVINPSLERINYFVLTVETNAVYAKTEDVLVNIENYLTDEQLDEDNIRLFLVMFSDSLSDSELDEVRKDSEGLDRLGKLSFNAFVPVIYETRAKRYIFHRAKGITPHDSSVRYFKKIVLC